MVLYYARKVCRSPHIVRWNVCYTDITITDEHDGAVRCLLKGDDASGKTTLLRTFRRVSIHSPPTLAINRERYLTGILFLKFRNSNQNVQRSMRTMAER